MKAVLVGGPADGRAWEISGKVEELRVRMPRLADHQNCRTVVYRHFGVECDRGLGWYYIYKFVEE